MGMNRKSGTGTTQGRGGGVAPGFYEGALDGQIAGKAKLPPGGERQIEEPRLPHGLQWVTHLARWAIEKLALRTITETFNLRRPVYQPPWVVPPFLFKSLNFHTTAGAGTDGLPFAPVTLLAGGAWTTVLTLATDDVHFAIVNQFGFDLTDPAGGPVNIPYQTTQYRFIKRGQVILGPLFGKYGSVAEPINQPLVHVKPNEPVLVQFANTHPATNWTVAARIGGWEYDYGQRTNDASIGIVS